MKMNKNLLYVGAGAIVLIAGVIIYLHFGHKNSPSTNTNIVTTNAPTSTNTQSASTQDPEDVVPGLYKNTIVNTATQPGFTISDVKVENNTDASGKVINDHLELTLKNTSGKDLSDFEVYYLITDTATGTKEGYNKKLTGFTLKNGETTSIHFDNTQGAGHFSANKDSLYYKSTNKLTFDVSVSTPGFKIETAQVTKDAGGAETKD